MALTKRILLFICINFLVLLTLSILLHLLHIEPYLLSYGIDIHSLLTFCLIWGMGGALISLFLSKKIALWSFGVKIIDENSIDTTHKELIQIVDRLAKEARLTKRPDLGIYHSDEVNAFATGRSKSSSLIALSSGLLTKMHTDEIKAVLGHEISHIANGDMVTMTLLQGITNAFSLFLSRIFAYLLTHRDRRGSRSLGSYYFFTFFFDMIFLLLGSILICHFSRRREFKADKNSADLTGKDNMIKALQRLKELSNRSNNRFNPKEQKAFAALKISQPNTKKSFLTKLFATHPSLDSRIAKLTKGI